MPAMGSSCAGSSASSMRCIAPVAIRFLGYGVPMDQAASEYVGALQRLPAFRQWREEAAREEERIEATEALTRAVQG